ncbi:hypothetical protein [Azospirillum palustre]
MNRLWEVAMSGVAVEDLPGLWSDELRGAKARLRPLFLL